VGFEYCHQVSSTPGEVPSAATLARGEVALNTADKAIYVKDSSTNAVVRVVGGNQVVSSGAISGLTSGQQTQVVSGTIVTTTDGRRWVYTGEGSKASEASYIELADITPVWSVIADKPADFPPSSHTHAISDVTSLQTSLDDKAASITTGITGASKITNMVSLTEASYTALSVKNTTTLYVVIPNP
jgi:hypothetical protein